MQLSPQEDKALKESLEFKSLSQTQGWLLLSQWLKAKRDESFPKPTDFRTIEEFSYAAMAVSSLKQSIVEILQYVEGQSSMSEELIKKQQAEEDKFRTVTKG